MDTVELIARGGRGLCAPAFDGDGRLLVCSSGDGRVLAVDGETLVEIGSTGGQPAGLCVDHSNTLYISDHAHAALVVLSHDGGEGAQAVVRDYEGRSLRGPSGAVFDSAGQLFFCDSGPYGDTGLHDATGSLFVVTGEASNRVLRPIALRCMAHPTGIALSPNEAALYVCEQATNRVLRFTQRPAGVWHGAVFHSFSGRLGPSAIVSDAGRGLIYVARPEDPAAGGWDGGAAGDAGASGSGSAVGVVSVLGPDGTLLRDLPLPGLGPLLSGLALTPDGRHLVVTEASGNTIHRILL